MEISGAAMQCNATSGIMQCNATLGLQCNAMRHLVSFNKEEFQVLVRLKYGIGLEGTCLLYTSPSPRD